jgi:hypothetical protein
MHRYHDARGTRGTRGAYRVCLLILLVSGGCALIRRPLPPVDRTQDPRILQEVQARLASEPSLDLGRIRVEVDAAIVLLYGSVDGIDAWQCAIRNAQLVAGVVTVVDYLVIERATRPVPCSARRDGPHTLGP